MEIEFTDQNFAEYTSQNKPMLIDFTLTGAVLAAILRRLSRH